jgi:hypothetical protein
MTVSSALDGGDTPPLAADRPLSILDYSWHQAHSYRLHALPATFYYAIYRYPVWNVAQRPMPPNFGGGIEPEALDEFHFDVALAHLDQWCDGQNNLRALPYRLMTQWADERGLPVVVIMHGTPDNEANRRAILRLIGDRPVVCNSLQAAEEWDYGEALADRYGLPQFRAIVHGYDVDEFWSEPLENRQTLAAITICSGGGMSREYHGIPLIERLKRDVPLVWYGPRGDREWKPDYMAYREFLARMLIYFSPTRRAPMPGARTEAMLSGCCIVTVPGHDVEGFIRHGETGFIVNTYEEARDTLEMLLRDPERAYEVGQDGRLEAMFRFDEEWYVKGWMDALREIGGA